MNTITSKNCIYISTFDMIYSDILEYLNNVIPVIENIVVRQMHPIKFPKCKWTINIPGKDKTIPRKFCYLWVNIKEICNILCGGSSSSGGSSNINTTNIFNIDWSNPPFEEIFYELPKWKDITPVFNYATATKVSKYYEEGKLFCNNSLSHSMITEYIPSIFAQFVTSGKLTITYNNKGNCYIMFDQKNDAYFALLMMKMYYSKRYKILLTFEYSKRY